MAAAGSDHRPRKSKGHVDINLGFGDALLTNHVLRRVRLVKHDRAATHDAIVRLETGCEGLKETPAGLSQLGRCEKFAPGQWPNLIIHRSRLHVDAEVLKTRTEDGYLPNVHVDAEFLVTDSQGFAEAFDGPYVMVEDVRERIGGLMQQAVRRVVEDQPGTDLNKQQSLLDEVQKSARADIPRRLETQGYLCLRLLRLDLKCEHAGLRSVDEAVDVAEVERMKGAVEARARVQKGQIESEERVDREKQRADEREERARIAETEAVNAAEREARIRQQANDSNMVRPPEPAQSEIPAAGASVSPGKASTAQSPKLDDSESANDSGTFGFYLRKATHLAKDGHHAEACNNIRQGLDVELKALAAECGTGFQMRFFDALGDVVLAPATVVQYLQTLAKLGNLGSHPDPNTQLTADDSRVALELGAAVEAWLDAGGRERIRGLDRQAKQKIRDKCRAGGPSRVSSRPDVPGEEPTKTP